MGYVFQSTHPHGVRPLCLLRMMRATSFNPRTHTGCDLLQSTAASTQQRFQSTHPHGVRHNDALPAATLKTFQSTHPHGVRPYCTRLYLSDYKFQSTHPHGVRRTLSEASRGRWRFQSTHPHGVRRQRSAVSGRGGGVSIHAPTRGATPLVVRVPRPLSVSIHAPTRGATAQIATGLMLHKFQSTHPHGVRHSLLI